MPSFTWDLDPVLFYLPSWLSFLPVDGIRYYSLLYVGVFLGGHKLFDWQVQRAGGDEEQANDFLLYGVIAVLAGARVGHVLFYEWDRFVENPAWLFMIHKGGLASHGAGLGLLLALMIFTKLRRQSFVEGCDRLCFSVALGAILVRAGNFFNSEIVGRQTFSDWGVRFPRYDGYVDPPLRHPSQLYEVGLGLVLMGTLLWVDRRAGKERRPRGLISSAFLIVYFGGRFGVEFFKEFQTLDDSAITMGQWLSLLPALVGCVALAATLKRKTPAEWKVFAAPGATNLGDDEADSDTDKSDDDIDDVLLDQR